MAKDKFGVGHTVLADYNSGTYIGKVIEERGNFLLIEVLAVKKHPDQGDLHNPGQVEGVAFLERKALAYREKMNARKRFVKPYDGEIPIYVESLKEAVESLKEQLEKDDTLFNQASLQKINQLEEHYYNKLFQAN